MESIKNLDILIAKDKCLELQKSNDRLVLKGNVPIVVTTTLLKINECDDSSNERLRLQNAYQNFYKKSNLDAFAMTLHEKCGVHSIIDYEIAGENYLDLFSQLQVNSKYKDKNIQKYILDNSAFLLLHLRMGSTVSGEQVEVGERNSSYTFMGITGASKELSRMFEENDFPNHMCFGGYPGMGELKNLGYDFTDEVIEFNRFIKLGIIKGRKLSLDKVWPRTVELTFNDDGLLNLPKIVDVLIEYFAWVEQELRDKGVHKAMHPMSNEERKYLKK